MNKNKPITHAQTEKLICDCTDKKKYLIHYTMLLFYVSYGMGVNKVHEIISLKQRKWLKKFLKSFNTQKKYG